MFMSSLPPSNSQFEVLIPYVTVFGGGTLVIGHEDRAIMNGFHALKSQKSDKVSLCHVMIHQVGIDLKTRRRALHQTQDLPAPWSWPSQPPRL